MIPLSRAQAALTAALLAISAIGLVAIVAFAGFPPEQTHEGAPTAGEVQSAYERAAAGVESSHDADLKVLQVDCRQVARARYSCRVDFVKADPARVFLDMAIVERRSGGWKLVRGLCRDLS